MFYQYRKYLIGLMLGLCLPALTKAQVIPLDPAVRTGKLSNGFTYYIRHNEEPKDRVVFYLANKVGSILETDEQQGLAHFMEHMSFNGTKHYPKNELVNYLQKSGVRFGADINAYTSFDETVYQLPLPANDPEILKNGIQIMRDWAQEATLEEDEINKERGVIMEEKRLGEGASKRIQRKTLPVMLNNSRYALRVPIGKENVLLNFKPAAIRSYYKDWYRPDLQALIVVGDIDADQMEKVVKAKFSDLRNPVAEKPRIKYTVPLTGKNQFLTVTDKELTNISMQIMFKHKAPELKTEADYRRAIVVSLFNQMLSGRYAELSRQADPPYLQGGAGIQELMGGLDAYEASVVVKAGELERGFKTVWRETHRIEVSGFMQTELDMAVQNYRSNMEAVLKEKDKTQSDAYVNEYLQYFLKQVAAPGITRENELVNRLLSGISLQDVNALTREYIKQTNRDIVLQAPEKDKAGLPDETTVLKWMSAVNEEKPGIFKDEIITLHLLRGTPEAGKIIKEEKNTVLGLTLLTLSNGVKVILKKTDFQNNQIIFSAYSYGGTSSYSDSDYQSAVNASGLIAAGGAGNYNALQLRKFLTGKQLNVNPYIGERTQGFNGAATPKDLEQALELLYAYFTEPRRDEEMFRGQIARAKAALANSNNDPGKVFGDTIKAVLGNYNIRRTAQTIEKLDQINLDRAFEIYKERFSDASGLTFTFAGSIDEETIRPLLERYLGSLPSKGVKEEAKDLGIQIPSGKISKIVYKGAEQKAMVQLILSGAFDYNYENVLKMDALQESLEIRLLERLREQESGVYSPSVRISTSKIPHERFNLMVSFGCSPANVEKLIASTLDEINKLKNDGPSGENINKFKAEDKLSRETALKTNDFWLSYLIGQQVDHEPLDNVLTHDDMIKKVTVSSLKETAEKYFTGDNYIRIILLPEEMKGK